jgi:tRNA-specific adenosine deaminase 2
MESHAADDGNATHIGFMRMALDQARLSAKNGEIPVGCVFVDRHGCVLAEGYNQTNVSRNGTRHSELVAIDDAILCRKIPFEAFRESTLYVTCEPCIMCAAAIAKLHIKRVYFGCSNDRFGGNGSILSIHSDQSVNNATYEITPDLLKEEAIEMFQHFYESENRRAPDHKRRKKQERSANVSDSIIKVGALNENNS